MMNPVDVSIRVHVACIIGVEPGAKCTQELLIRHPTKRRLLLLDMLEYPREQRIVARVVL
jgi:hypothetical protein